MMHPEVLEVAVYGVPDATTGEAVVAEVMPRPGSQPEPEELRRHAAQHLAAYKVPLHVLLRTEPLPRNPAGKALKSPLREAFLQARPA